MVCKSTNAMVPYFNAFIYLENKTKIGKLDEIFGPSNLLHFTVKPDDGVVATSFKAKDKVYVAPDKLLPMSRFTGDQKSGGGGRGGARGRGGDRGGRGGRGGGGDRGRGRGGSGGFTPRGRGGFTPRGRGAPAPWRGTPK